MEDFFTIHSGLDREGPGSDASTRRALTYLPDLTGPVSILDLGCGPGAQALTLAKALPEARVTGIDRHEPYVEAVRERAAEAGVADRVTAIVGDIGALEGIDAVDVVWSEGAAYAIGFTEALARWRDLLHPGGVLVLSEPVWIAPTVPQAVSDFWAEAYPDMQPVQVRRAQILEAGYKRVGDFTLPRSDWEDYYAPLRARLDEVRHDPAMDAVVAAHDREIAIFEAGGATTVGYQMFVLHRPA